MRKLERITFTGVDQWTNIDELCKIQEEYPKTEFGILLSENFRGNGPRYLDPKDLTHFLDLGLNLSGHLCGGLAREACRGNIQRVLDFCGEGFNVFQRIQLNCSITPPTWTSLDDIITRNLTEVILQRIYSGDIPENKDPRLSILMDPSGGQGIYCNYPVPTGWSGKVGYAGGLEESNIVEFLEHLKIIHEDGLTWVDMETGVRTEEKFDLEKVRKVLERAYSYVE